MTPRFFGHDFLARSGGEDLPSQTIKQSRSVEEDVLGLQHGTVYLLLTMLSHSRPSTIFDAHCGEPAGEDFSRPSA